MGAKRLWIQMMQINGYITLQQAHASYGVDLDPVTLEVKELNPARDI